jgi:hypothetical protein
VSELPEAKCIRCACGRDVEPARHCYAIPTCYACLPPPAPLPRIWIGAPNVVDIEVARQARADRRAGR